MSFSPKSLIIVLVLVGAVFVGFTIIRLGELLAPQPVMPQATSTPGGGTEPGGSSTPPNAFIPQQGNGNQPPIDNQIQRPIPLPPDISQFPKPSIPEIKKKIEASIPPPTPKSEMLAFPAIPDSEIKIDPAGLKTTDEYLAYFAVHAKDVSFDTSRFGGVLKDANNIVLHPAKLIEKVLAGDTSPALKASLQIFKDAIGSQISFFERIGVFGEAAAYNKKMIGFQKLQVQLLDQGLAVVSGNMAKETLRDFSLKLKNSALQENSELLQRIGLFSSNKPIGFFKKLANNVLEFLGLREEANAQLSTGGRIIFTFTCTCSIGDYLAYNTGQSGTLYINLFWSIANFAIFSAGPPSIGMEYLATYTPAPIPCMIVVTLGCATAGAGFMPIIMGTGL